MLIEDSLPSLDPTILSLNNTEKFKNIDQILIFENCTLIYVYVYVYNCTDNSILKAHEN